MSKSSQKLPEVQASYVVDVAKALREIGSKVGALRVKVAAFKRAYGKNAPKLLGRLRRMVRVELNLTPVTGKGHAKKNVERNAKWNTYRVTLDRVCKELGLSKPGKGNGGKGLSKVARLAKASKAQLVAALKLKGYAVTCTAVK